MRAIITVFVAEFTGKDDARTALLAHCETIQEVAGALIFSPRPGKLFDLLNFLKQNNIAYGTHFSTDEAIKVKGQGEV